MRYLSIVIIILLMSSCGTQVKPENNLDWLLGTWNRTNNQEGQKTYEYWERKSATVLEGIGYTLVGTDTVSKEFMKIFPLNGALTCEVIAGNDPPVNFKFTSQVKQRFICENQQNEFPKKIEYFMEEKQLKAIISNDEITFDFIFER